jgi:pimeloyl-ACP methyl ester carboxylesterase
MARVESADGIELYAEAHGQGIPLLFSCAYATTRENWRSQVEPLVAAGARVVLWDYRGHGLSDAPHDRGAYSMDRVLEDLDRVLTWAVGSEPAVLAGLSFGGLASLHFAARHLNRIRGLVLIASGPGFKNPDAAAHWQARSNRTAEYIETQGFDAFVGGKAGPTCIGSDPELPAARVAAAAIRAQDPTSVGLFGRQVAGAAPSVIDDLQGIRRPALVIVGEHDPGFQRAAEVMADKLPDARSETIPNAGHILNIEVAPTFNTLLIGFLDSLRGAGAGQGRP